MKTSQNKRILVIDDNPAIHNDFAKILANVAPEATSLNAKEELLFGEAKSESAHEEFVIQSAFQGEEGLEMVAEARRQGQPFALAFVDVRMPPGWDGVETIERIWPVDPEIQIVVCSAYSDFSFRDIMIRMGVSDRLLMLRKPCDGNEILAMAMALCEKWNLARFKTGSTKSSSGRDVGIASPDRQAIVRQTVSEQTQ